MVSAADPLGRNLDFLDIVEKSPSPATGISNCFKQSNGKGPSNK
jgi:hypothetical protein